MPDLHLALTPEQIETLDEAIELCPDCQGHRLRAAPIRVPDPRGLAIPGKPPPTISKLIVVPCPRCSPIIAFLTALCDHEFPRKEDEPPKPEVLA